MEEQVCDVLLHSSLSLTVFALSDDFDGMICAQVCAIYVYTVCTYTYTYANIIYIDKGFSHKVIIYVLHSQLHITRAAFGCL